MTDPKRIRTAVIVADEIVEEAISAMSKFPEFHSAHEGFAVLQEEVDELWDEVKKSPKKRDPPAMRLEAIQVGAMALRFLIDCCKKQGEQDEQSTQTS